jgi:(p)ppGpp synthase/HD superfamily hydrolase
LLAYSANIAEREEIDAKWNPSGVRRRLRHRCRKACGSAHDGNGHATHENLVRSAARIREFKKALREDLHRTFAKTDQAKEHLQNQFKDHSAGRVYAAIAEGRVLPEQFTIRSILAENSAFRVYSTKNASAGKPAVTHVRVLKRNAKTSMLEVRLETGRKHQIRVHLAERGHPIAGDKVYGSRSSSLGRLGLHGTQLEFEHPRTKQRLRFDSPCPPNWR